MATSPTSIRQRPIYRNIHVTQITRYRLPPSAWVSILHRISGALLFLLIPFVIWLFDVSVTSEVSYERFAAAYQSGAGWFPGWFIKLVTFGLIWAYLFHFIAGLRHLWMDVTHSVSKQFGRTSSIVTLVLSTLLTLALGWKLFF